MKRPVFIVHALRKKAIQNIPTRRQISSFLSDYRAKTRQINRLLVAPIEAWCEENSAFPTDIDKLFVAAHDVSNNEGAVTMRMFFTTRRLLEPIEFVMHVTVDGTYKLNYQGLLCIMIGTTDKPFCFAITIKEEEADYHFVFKILEDTVLTIFGRVFKPSSLIADAAHSITNGFNVTFGVQEKRVMCKVHMFTNITKRFN